MSFTRPLGPFAILYEERKAPALYKIKKKTGPKSRTALEKTLIALRDNRNTFTPRQTQADKDRSAALVGRGIPNWRDA